MSPSANPAATAVSQTKVLLVDDHPIYSSALAEVLCAGGDFAVVGSAENGADALAFLCAHPVDLLLVDLMMPGMSGLEIIAAALEAMPDLKVVVFTGLATPESMQAAFGLGVCAFLVKSSPVPELLESIRAVVRGEFPLDPAVSEILRDLVRLHSKKKPLAADDLRILRLLAADRTPKEIADEMARSLSSVYKSRDRIAARLDAKSNRDLVPRAQALGLVPAGRDSNLWRLPAALVSPEDSM